MDDQKKSPGLPLKLMDLKERNRHLRIEWERAAIHAEFEKVEDIMDIMNMMNMPNAENLQQMHNNQKSFVNPADALVTKQPEVVKKLNFLKQTSNLIPNDNRYNNYIRQLEKRTKEQDKEISDRLATLSKRELKNELAEIYKSANAIQLEVQRHRIEKNSKSEAWRKNQVESWQHIENIKKDYDSKMSIINRDIDTLDNIIKDEIIEFCTKMKKAFEHN